MSYGEELTACFRNIAEIKDETTKNYFLTLFRLWLPPSYNISFVDVNDNVDTKNAEEKKKITGAGTLKKEPVFGLKLV